MTNPDISTLNGALEQLGITMADNLVTMGVSDADPSDGLTTLAGKILLVPQGGGVATLTLAKTAGKQILSYADKTSGSGNTEYCTVTATALDSNNQGVSGQSVVFKVGSSTVATETTDSNGEASYTYTSQGSGDVVLSAECSSLIQTYTIEDNIRVGFKGITLSAPAGRSTSSTVLNDNLFKQSPNGGAGAWGLGLFECDTDYVMQFKVGSYSSGSGARAGFQSTDVTNGSWTEKGSLTIEIESNNKKISYATSTGNISKVNGSWNLNSIIKVEVSSTTAKVYVDDTLATTLTLDWLHDPIHLWGHGWSGSGNVGISDFKVKPL